MKPAKQTTDRVFIWKNIHVVWKVHFRTYFDLEIMFFMHLWSYLSCIKNRSEVAIDFYSNRIFKYYGRGKESPYPVGRQSFSGQIGTLSDEGRQAEAFSVGTCGRQMNFIMMLKINFKIKLHELNRIFICTVQKTLQRRTGVDEKIWKLNSKSS